MSLQDFRRNFTEFKYSFQTHSQANLLAITMFSLILLIAFLYCYYLYFRHYFSTTDFFTSSSRHSTSAPLDSAAIKSLPIFRHRSPAATPDGGGDGPIVNNVKESECSICLGLFEDEEMIKVLPKCNHAYHSECVDQWLTNRSSCPLCRASLQC